MHRKNDEMAISQEIINKPRFFKCKNDEESEYLNHFYLLSVKIFILTFFF